MAVVMIVSGVGGLFLSVGTASADVDSVEGTGYGLSAFVGGQFLIPPAPDPTVNPPLLQANEASVDFGPHASSVLTLGGILGILNNGVAVGPVVTQAGNIVGENHGGFIATSSQVANVSILTDTVNIPLIQTTCVSNGDGSTGTTNVSNARLGLPGSQLLNGPIAPNTVVDVLGLLTVTLNEQVITNTPPSGGNPGSTQIRVRGAVVRIPADGSIAEVVLAESFCRAVGPDVLLPSTTSSTAAPTTSTTLGGTTSTTGATTSTTSATTSTTLATTSSSSTTSTTSPPTGTVASTTTTVAGVVTTVGSGVLVRTGSNLQPLGVLSMVSIVLGILLLIGSGRPLTAHAVAGGGPGYGPSSGAGPEKWGPVEIGKTIWAGFAMVIIGPGEFVARRRRQRRADE